MTAARSKASPICSVALRAVVLEPRDVVDSLCDVSVPVLVLAGEHDYVLPVEVRRRPPGRSGDEVVLVGGGHVSPEEGPVAVFEQTR